MFGSIGFQEILIILVVVLIFFGPKRLPDLAKGIGKGIAEFKKASEEVRKGIDEAMKEETTKEETPKAEPPKTEAANTEVAKTEAVTLQPTLPYLEPPKSFDETKGPAPPSSEPQG